MRVVKKEFNFNNLTYSHEEIKQKLERVFPELEEDEDERIRKNMLEYCYKRMNNEFPSITIYQVKEWLAWLEKQGSLSKINEKLRQYREYLVKETERWHKNEEDETLSKIGKQDCIGHANAYISARSEFEDLFNYDSWLEKQGEQKSQGKSALEVWKDMRLEVYQQASGNRHEPNCSDDSTKMFSLTDIDEIFEQVAEKQGEQKPNDKVEPKFKVGDTIRPKGSMAEYTIESISGECYHGKGWGLHISCDDDYELVEQKHTDKVESKFEIEKGKWYVCNTPRYKDFVVGKEYYCPKNGMLKPNENEMALYVARSCFHPWTIQDVKDGDVLVVGDEDGEGIAICGKDDTIGNNNLYCAYDDENGFIINVKIAKECLLHPATIEQGELLFKKMNKAGYVWDFEKKELIQIEQTPTTITDDWVEDYWNHNKVTNPDSYNGGEEIQFDHDGFIRFCQAHCQKSAWSEEDEEILHKINQCIYDNVVNIGTMNKVRYTDWLESIKKRMKGV